MAEKVWDTQSPPLGRYAGFVAVTTLFSLLIMTLWPFFGAESVTELVNLSIGSLWIYVFFLFWGSPFWVPVFVFALFPGFVVYRAVVRNMTCARSSPKLAIGAAALVTSLVSSIGLPVGLWIIGPERGMQHFMAQLLDPTNYWPLCFGAPAALLSAFLVLYKNEAT